MSEPTNLRRAALRGGAYLAARQVVSILLKFIGVLVITRLLGPANYGAFVSGLNIYNYALALGTAGVGVYLLRHEGDVPERDFGTSYSILMMMGLVLFVVIQLGVGSLAKWTGVAGFAPVMRVIAFALIPQLLAIPASVRLERRLDYRSVAINEILSQVAYYLLAVPLVLLNFGPVALASGTVVSQIALCVLAHASSKTYPRFSYQRSTARNIVRYAADFSVANWIWQMRGLVNPLIVGPVLGAQAVGIIGMTIGILELLTTIKGIAWRLSVAILTKFRTDIDRLRMAVTEGMELQVLVTGTILLGFGWTGQFIIPRLFGARWIGVTDIYPYIALSYLTMSTFNIHSATLSVINRNRDLAIHHLISVSAFAGVAYLAVSRLGIIGYGIGELCTIPVYFVMHLILARIIGSPSYTLMAVWWLGAAAGLFWKFEPWAIAAPFIALATPISIKKIRQYLREGLTRH